VKILVVNNLYFPNIKGGAEVSTQIICEQLVELGHQVVVYSLDNCKSQHQSEINGVKVNYLPIKNVYWPFDESTSRGGRSKLNFFAQDAYNLKVSRQFQEIIRNEQPDIVHTSNLYGFSVSVWSAAKINKIPVVHTLRDYYLLCRKGSLFVGGDNCEKRCLSCQLYSVPRSLVSQDVSAVIGVSQHILRAHLSAGLFGSASIRSVIHNPYRPKRDVVISISANSKPSNGLVFGYIGRVSEEKGIGKLIAAFARLNDSSSILRIAGAYTEEYKNHLTDLAGESKVQFLGHIDAESFFSQIDVLVMPSLWHEPFGRGVVEAYAYGLPVIASRRGGLQEIVLDPQNSLFEPTDVDSIVHSLRWASSSTFSKTEFTEAAVGYAPLKLAEEVEGLYRNVLGR